MPTRRARSTNSTTIWRPSLPESVAIVALAALMLWTLLPGVTFAPYEDPLAAEEPDSLRRRVADDALPLALRLRALDALAGAAGEAEAVRIALASVRTRAEANSDEGRARLTWAARRPVSALAGEVWLAWQHGRLPDTVWRDEFLAHGWGEAAAWFALPLLYATEPEAEQLFWLVDVLGRAGSAEFAVPTTTNGEAGDVRFVSGPRLLVTYAQEYFDRTPPRRMRPRLELRLFEAIRHAPAYLARDVERLARQSIAARRLPAVENRDGVTRAHYVEAVWEAARAAMPADAYGELLQATADSDEPHNAYSASARQRLPARTPAE